MWKKAKNNRDGTDTNLNQKEENEKSEAKEDDDI